LVEDSFEGLPGQFPALGQGHEFGLGEDLAVGGGLAGIAELVDQGQGLLDDEGFDGVGQAQGAGLHGGAPGQVFRTAVPSCSV